MVIVIFIKHIHRTPIRNYIDALYNGNTRFVGSVTYSNLRLQCIWLKYQCSVESQHECSCNTTFNELYLSKTNVKVLLLHDTKCSEPTKLLFPNVYLSMYTLYELTVHTCTYAYL